MYYQFFVHVFLYDTYTSHAACLYGDVINIAKMCKSDTSKLVNSLKHFIRTGDDWVIIIHTLRQVIAKNIDNLQLQLVGPTSN